MLICNRKIIFDHFCYRYFSAYMLQNASFIFINTKSCSKIWLCLRNRERKSVGCEQTFLEDIYAKSAVIIELYHTVLELLERIAKSGFEGRTLTLKVKFSDFTQITRSISQEKILTKKDDILPLAKQLLQLVNYSSSRPIRLLGLSVSNATSEEARKEDKENSTLKPEYRELELEFEEWKE